VSPIAKPEFTTLITHSFPEEKITSRPHIYTKQGLKKFQSGFSTTYRNYVKSDLT